MSVPVTVGVIIGAVVVGATVSAGTSNLEAKHRVEAAAENAALAAADSHFGWMAGEPCALAETLAQRSATELTTCEIRQFDVTISLRVHTLVGDHIGVARAGIGVTLLGL